MNSNIPELPQGEMPNLHIKEMPALKMSQELAAKIDENLTGFRKQVRTSMLYIQNFDSKATCEQNVRILESLAKVVQSQIELQKQIISSNKYDY